jgi:hypothetical protein
MNSAWITTVAAISAAAMLNWKNTQVTHFFARIRELPPSSLSQLMTIE